MDSQARHELSKAIQREGVVLFENPQRIKALLMDTCPESPMEIGLLIQAAEDDIPARLDRTSNSVFRDSEIARAVADLKKTRRLDDGAAEWVVRSWAWALGVLDTEPSDDVDEATSATSGSLSGGQAESPPYPSTPPSGPGDATSFPPAGSSSRSGPGPYTEPWQTRVTSGGPSASVSPGGPPWASHPTVQGPAAGSGGSTPPPTTTEGGAASPPPPPPPDRGRWRLFAVLGAVAVAAVIVLAGVGVAIFRNLGPPPAPPAVTSTNAEQPTINFTITTTLADWEVAETTTVYSFGQKVGVLQINASQPTASLPMETEGGGNVDIQLQITLVHTNGQQYTFNGAGEITVYEGAVYTVDIDNDGADNYWATLVAQQSDT